MRHAEDERMRADSDGIAGFEHYWSGQADATHEGAVLAVKVFNRGAAVVDDDARVAPRYLGRVHPDGDSGFPADHVFALGQRERAGAIRQPAGRTYALGNGAVRR